MTLTDTGPLVALLDDDDSHHAASLVALGRLPPVPLLTTWPCFTEAMYLLGVVGGHKFQQALWQMRSRGKLLLHDLSQEEADNMSQLMHTYRDTPMDLADASLIVAAEGLALRQIFTFDKHFYIYRVAGGNVLEIIR